MARFALALLLLTPAPALAHKLNIYAQAKGDSIVGHAYFPGNVPAKQIDVIARDRPGHELARTKTDDQGDFTLRVTIKTDYQITAETPDGHSACYALSAAELPDSLPADASVPTTRADASSDRASLHDAASNGPASNSLNDQVDALQKQVQALRIQIDQSEQRTRFRDMLGGIGYILGLAGVAFYFKARQSTKVRQIKSMPVLSKEH